MGKLERGFVQVYTGDGKGKTTAALGLAFRAAGHGMKTLIVQFMKGCVFYGELESAKKMDPYIKIVQVGREEFVKKGDPDEIDVRLAREGLELAYKAISSGEYDIVVLDEINVAVDYGLIPLEEVLDLIRNKPENLELVLTGRYAHPEIVKAADLVTEMLEIKHYYSDKGVDARDGIER
ncbi:MAG: cob(I)yrinic acid a,c-diamide adenosyltransferase [Thermosulfidibacteraceae bacterium]